MDNCNRHTDVAVELIKGAKSALFLYLTGGNLMNNKRRKELRRAIDMIETALDIVNQVKDEEEVKKIASVLYDEAMMLEGFEIEDKQEFLKNLNDLLTKAY